LSLFIYFRYTIIVLKAPLTHGRFLSVVHVVFVYLLANEYCVKLKTTSYNQGCGAESES